ncbi:MAG TPA: alpha/beta fold hydrolase [Solirubrobacteraceae bacterium]|nr:alpha/beta fold hydrolase [Solirubrobacteraceae bacterium]
MSTTVRTPGLVLTEHTLTVPLDHDHPGDGRTIELFAREVADPEGADKPLLVYLQGGPGFEAPRPAGNPKAPSWLERALEDFRVLMLDQRGTGRSTPVGPATLAGLEPAHQAEYLTHFRADAIVRDAEALRGALGVERWSVLGQSFGGFCVVAYLSLAPDGLREALIAGGLPPLRTPVDEIYRDTYARVLERSRRYFMRYPEDRLRLRALEEAVQSGIRLPSGDALSWRRVRQLGQWLGMSDGADSLHHLLELPFDSPAFRHDVAAPMGFERNPLYAVLHESCYADGGLTGWSAERMLPPQYAQDPLLFTGEHVFPWMFEEYGELRPFAEAAELLAHHEWPTLYDPQGLAACEVPAAAVIYHEDMYVERAHSERTAAAIRGLRPWVTSEYDHDGIRADGARVLGRLLDLARGRA